MQRTEGVSFLHPCVAVRSGRQVVEEKEEKRKGKKKRGETRKKQGLTFDICSIFLQIKSAEQGRRKCKNQ